MRQLDAKGVCVEDEDAGVAGVASVAGAAGAGAGVGAGARLGEGGVPCCAGLPGVAGGAVVVDTESPVIALT